MDDQRWSFLQKSLGHKSKSKILFQTCVVSINLRNVRLTELSVTSVAEWRSRNQIEVLTFAIKCVSTPVTEWTGILSCYYCAIIIKGVKLFYISINGYLNHY